MIIFPTTDLMDEQKCYDWLVIILHPRGFECPQCRLPVEASRVHRRDRDPVLYFKCMCGRIFNVFSETEWQGTHHPCSKIIRILQGFTQGIPTLHLAQELKMDRKHLLERRHRMQSRAAKIRSSGPLNDSVIEGDELFQNAGEKRCQT